MIHQFYLSKSLFFISCLLFILSNGNLEAQTFAWAKKFGGTNASLNPPFWDQGIDLDGSGNIYTISNFSGNVDFDPGAGVFNMNAGNGSFSVQKLDASGNFVWAKQLMARIQSIAVDNAGNVYLAGNFSQTQDFDPSPAIYNLTSVGYDDLYILKLDANGNFLWAKSVGSPVGEINNDIHISFSGNVYITGQFAYFNSSQTFTADFDPDPVTTYNLTSAGGGDGFVLKLDGNGSFLSVLHKSSSANDQVVYLATDVVDNIYYYTIFNGNRYIEKVDAGYNTVWSVLLPLIDVYDIAVDQNQNVITCGNFWGTFDFNHGPGILTMSSPNYQSLFNMKYAADGSFMWANTVKTNSHANSVAIDGSGNVYTTGCFHLNGPVDFDPGPGSFTLKNQGSGTMFIQKFNPAGQFLWAGQIGGERNTNTAGRGILISNTNEIITDFTFNGTIDVNPGSAKFTLSSAGNTDMAIHKMMQSISPPQRSDDIIVSESGLINNRIKAYPNPNNGSFYIDIPAIGDDAKLEIYSLSGQLMVRRSFNGKNEQRLFMNKEIRTAGVYLLQVSGKDKTFTTKIAVQ